MKTMVGWGTSPLCGHDVIPWDRVAALFLFLGTVSENQEDSGHSGSNILNLSQACVTIQSLRVSLFPHQGSFFDTEEP